MIYDNLLSSHCLLLEGPERNVLLDVLLVSATKGQEEVVKELVTHHLLLISDLALNDLSLFNFLLTVDFTILLSVITLERLELFGVEDV